MASAADLRELEALCPWTQPAFRAGLDQLGQSAAQAARQHAADARVLAALVAMVPRCPFDERAATPWTSFRREVAVARKLSDQAAAGLIRSAVALTSTLPTMLALLESGQATVERATAFVRELEPHSDELARQVDLALAARAATLPPWRIAQEVRRAVHVLDPDAGAMRVATKNAARGVELQPQSDDQASVTIFGPAVPVLRWHTTLDQQARALKQAGDPRTLDQLRFDLATSTYPCTRHTPTDPTAADPVAAAVVDGCSPARPVQAQIVVPVETALGLSNEPGWLDGYGWLSAPTSRQLLIDAELRQACAHTGTGQLLDLATRTVRPPPTPTGVRAALLDMVLDDTTLTGIADRTEPQHDPSEPLRRFVTARDRTCDGPTGSQVSARRCHLDHDQAHPTGPTAAWNLAARATRTHQLKHHGWTPLRTPTKTIWISPAGQTIEVPNHHDAPPGIDQDHHSDTGPNTPVVLPDPDELDLIDRAQLEAPTPDGPPWLPASERDTTTWTWLTHDDHIAC